MFLLTSISSSRQPFGEDEDAGGELDEAEQRGENGALFVLSRTSFLYHSMYLAVI